MGQQQLQTLREQLKTSPFPPPTDTLSPIEALLKHTQQLTGHTLTPLEIQQHLINYLHGVEVTRRRSRSYQLLHLEESHQQQIPSSQQQISGCSRELQNKMLWLQNTQENIRSNITELMVSQQSHKIRQKFRKLILNILKIDNLELLVARKHQPTQIHNFKNNTITVLAENQLKDKINQIIDSPINENSLSQVIQILGSSSQENQLLLWKGCCQSKMSLIYLVTRQQSEEIVPFSSKIVQKIANVVVMSSAEDQSILLQSYSRQLLQIFQLLILQCQGDVCSSIVPKYKYMQQVQAYLLQKQQKDDNLLHRVKVFQQLQYQILQRIRMYKKYICQDDKVFLQFDTRAQLSFISNNIPHPLLKNIANLYLHKKLFLEQIFSQHKPVLDFIKKAVQHKVKGNRMYQLTFQSKIRVIYDVDGRINRMHVVLEEIGDSSSNSSHIYNSSSTKILSQGSHKDSNQDIEDSKERKQSTLVKNLEKQNPGIINQGWINLFMKDPLINPRKNTYFKTKPGKGYTIKRSISLNHNIDYNSEPKDNLYHFDIQSTDLNLLILQEDLLEPLVLKVMRQMQFFMGDNVNQHYFLNFLGDLHGHYQTHNNPFHNFTHGVNVMHSCYLLVNSLHSKIQLSAFKMFTIVFAGLCHDVGHTGFTNLFEIASGSKKAITYNDSSPLENYHAATTFELLRKPQNNFLKGLSQEEIKYFRKLVISSILYTDIKEHFPLLKKFSTILKEEIPINDDYISILAGMIVHTSDFGGSAKEFEICKAWSLKVNLQFSNQYKKEGQLGLPQTPFLKDLTNPKVLSKNEGGFLKVIVLPLYQAMDQYCGNEPRVRRLREYAQNNIHEWQKIQQNSTQSQSKKE